MIFDTILISEATDAQLRTYAEMLGADIEPSYTREDVVTAIHMIMPDITAIRLPAAPEVPHGVAAPAPAAMGADPVAVVLSASALRSSAGDPRVTLMIPSEERDGTTFSSDVNVGVNGVVTQLRRGVHLQVPYRVFEALANAQRTVITHDGDGNVVESVAQAYPFQVSIPADLAEVREWKERTGAVELA